MAASDLILVKPVITQTIPGVGSTTTHGVSEERTLGSVLTGTTAAAAGQSGTVVRQTAPAAAPVPFADLTAAANSFNSLRTALIAAGVLI